MAILGANIQESIEKAMPIGTTRPSNNGASLKDFVTTDVLAEAMTPSKTAHKLSCCDNIPAELLKRRCWVLHGEKDGREKAPMQINGAGASSTDPAHWIDYETARNAFIKDGGNCFKGLGVVLGDRLCGVDIDGGINDDGTLTPFAADIVARLNSYTEVSQSGKGLHVLVIADWPKAEQSGLKYKLDEGHRAVEIYGHSRYFIFTGCVYSGYAGLSESEQTKAEFNSLVSMIDNLQRTSEYVNSKFIHAKSDVLRIQPAETPTGESITQLAQRINAAKGKYNASLLSDSEMLDIGRKWKNGSGEKFAALYDSGDTSGYASASEADLALCNYLAHVTQGDKWRMDKLFRDSALYRPKWDRSTYGEVTINKAIARWLDRGGLFND